MGLSPSPGRSSIHLSCSFTWRAASSLLPCLSLLRTLYSIITKHTYDYKCSPIMLVIPMVVYFCICSQNISSFCLFCRLCVCVPAHEVVPAQPLDLFYSSCRLFVFHKGTDDTTKWDLEHIKSNYKTWDKVEGHGSVKCAVRTLFCQHNISFIYNKICKL